MLHRQIVKFVLIVTEVLFLPSLLYAGTWEQRNESIALALELAQARERSPAEPIKYEKKIEKSAIEQEIAQVEQEIDAYFRYIPSRKAEAQDGKVGIIDSEIEYTYAFKAFDKLPVELSVGQQYIGIENTTRVELPAHLNGVSFGVQTTLHFFFKDTYLRTAVYPSFFGDDWNFDSSDFRIPVHTYLVYQPSEKATFILGAAVFPDYEDKFSPIIGMIYKPNDRLTFRLIPKRPGISYKLTDKLTVFAEGDSSSGEFEVTKDDYKSAVLKYREVHAGGGVKYEFNKYIQASVSGGAVFSHYLKYRDSLGKVDIKDGMYSEFRLEVKI